MRIGHDRVKATSGPEGRSSAPAAPLPPPSRDHARDSLPKRRDTSRAGRPRAAVTGRKPPSGGRSGASSRCRPRLGARPDNDSEIVLRAFRRLHRASVRHLTRRAAHPVGNGAQLLNVRPSAAVRCRSRLFPLLAANAVEGFPQIGLDAGYVTEVKDGLQRAPLDSVQATPKGKPSGRPSGHTAADNEGGFPPGRSRRSPLPEGHLWTVILSHARIPVCPVARIGRPSEPPPGLGAKATPAAANESLSDRLHGFRLDHRNGV